MSNPLTDTDANIEQSIVRWMRENDIQELYSWVRSSSYYAVIVELGKDEPKETRVLKYTDLNINTCNNH